MKVLQLAKFYPPVRGGIETVVQLLARAGQRAGWPTAVLCTDLGRLTRRERDLDGVEIVRAGSLGTLLSTSLSPALLRQARCLVPAAEIVHVHMPNPMATLALRLTPPPGRLVVHWHSDVVRQQRALRVYEPLQQWLLARADQVIATSLSYAQSSLALRPWLGKVDVIPLGICDTLQLDRPGAGAAIRARHGGHRLVFALGRMAGYKGFDVLIDACAMLPPDVHVVIGGNGPLLEPLRSRVAARGLGGRVSLPGPIPEDELSSYFTAADIFCVPSISRAEAFGVAMLEAMACGRPVVASKLAGSGVPWVNAHGVTGLNVPPGDPAALAHALRSLLDDPDTAGRMGRAARARFLAEFTAEHMIERTFALYRALGVPAAPARLPTDASGPGAATTTPGPSGSSNPR